jgi:hypothetical protein
MPASIIQAWIFGSDVGLILSSVLMPTRGSIVTFLAILGGHRLTHALDLRPDRQKAFTCAKRAFVPLNHAHALPYNHEPIADSMGLPVIHIQPPKEKKARQNVSGEPFGKGDNRIMVRIRLKTGFSIAECGQMRTVFKKDSNVTAFRAIVKNIPTSATLPNFRWRNFWKI